jgi:hypothetical protein
VGTGVRKIQARETNENRENVAVQIKKLIPTMMARAGSTALGPPATARTGKEVRMITRLRRADLRTTLRKLGAADSSWWTGAITGFSVGGSMVIP